VAHGVTAEGVKASVDLISRRLPGTLEDVRGAILGTDGTRCPTPPALPTSWAGTLPKFATISSESYI